jgi:hypothetical protein
MKPISLISSDLFDAIRSRFTNLEMGDENGMITLDPNVARFFDFDFDVEDTNLGRVSISLNELGNLKIFYSQGILEDTDPIIQERWFGFLRKMRKFAKRRLLRFDTRDITKSNLKKEDFKFLARKKNKEKTMNESTVYGSSMSSFMPLQKTLLIIRHKRPVGLTRGDRSRQIKSIFIQNDEGERFKMPINCLRTSRAMQRHCANGGRPYDNLGTVIIQMGSECSQLRDFKRRCKMDSMQEATHKVIQAAHRKFESLKEQLDSMCSQGGYENFKSSAENHSVEEVLVDESTLQQYREQFSQTVFREDLSQYFPLLEKIMRQAGEIDLTTLTNEQTNLETDETSTTEEVKEFKDFENWADSVESDKLTDKQIENLLKFIEENPDAIGVDGTNALEGLGDIFDVTDELKELISEEEGFDLKTVLSMYFKKIGDQEASEALKNQSDDDEVSDDEDVDDEDDDDEVSDDEPGGEMTPPPPPGGEMTPPPPPGGEMTPPAGGMTPPAGGMTPGGSGLQQPQPTAEGKTPAKTKIRKIAQMVKSFYNAEAAEQGNGPWTIGETAVIRKVRKRFGKQAKRVAKHLIKELTEKHMIKQEKTHEETMFEDVLRLSGIKK